MKPSAIRIERLLEKLEATLVAPPRPCLRIITHQGDDEAAAMEKALAEHVACHPEDAGRTSQPSDTQQAQQQQQAPDEQARKEADEKAWADAEKAGTAAAYTAYLQNFGSGTHVSEASQRIVALMGMPGQRWQAAWKVASATW